MSQTAYEKARDLFVAASESGRKTMWQQGEYGYSAVLAKANESADSDGREALGSMAFADLSKRSHVGIAQVREYAKLGFLMSKVTDLRKLLVADAKKLVVEPIVTYDKASVSWSIDANHVTTISEWIASADSEGKREKSLDSLRVELGWAKTERSAKTGKTDRPVESAPPLVASPLVASPLVVLANQTGEALHNSVVGIAETLAIHSEGRKALHDLIVALGEHLADSVEGHDRFQILGKAMVVQKKARFSDAARAAIEDRESQRTEASAIA